MKAPAVYLLASGPRGTLYVGVTSNLVKRVWQHRDGLADGFTKLHDVKTLVWYEQYQVMASAIAREKAIKKWQRQWKLKLIEDLNPEWRDLWCEITEAGWSAEPSAEASIRPNGNMDSRLRGNDEGVDSGTPGEEYRVDSRSHSDEVGAGARKESGVGGIGSPHSGNDDPSKDVL